MKKIKKKLWKISLSSKALMTDAQQIIFHFYFVCVTPFTVETEKKIFYFQMHSKLVDESEINKKKRKERKKF